MFFKDVALIRYLNPQTTDDITKSSEYQPTSVHVVNDVGFMNTMKLRANHGFWYSLECIQTNVKAQIGCGTPIIVDFFAPIDEIEDNINYDFRSLGEDEDLIRLDEEKYCLKQVYKICFYIQKLYQVDILRMQCDFVKDYHGTIWFQFAKNIQIRPNMNEKRATEE